MNKHFRTISNGTPAYYPTASQRFSRSKKIARPFHSQGFKLCSGPRSMLFDPFLNRVYSFTGQTKYHSSREPTELHRALGASHAYTLPQVQYTGLETLVLRGKMVQGYQGEFTCIYMKNTHVNHSCYTNILLQKKN